MDEGDRAARPRSCSERGGHGGFQARSTSLSWAIRASWHLSISLSSRPTGEVAMCYAAPDCALTRATTPDRSRHGAPGTWVFRGRAVARRLLQPAQLSLVAGRAGRHPRPPRSANPADHVREPDRSDRGCAPYDPAYRLLQWSPPRRRGICCRICWGTAVPPRYSRESYRNASTPTTTRHYASRDDREWRTHTFGCTFTERSILGSD
jgi:hypothetical protein